MNPPRRNASAGVVEEIRALMGRRRVSQKQLGEALGLAQPTMSKRMNGKIPFDLDELDAIAEFFDVPITDLFGRPIERETPGQSPETRNRWSSSPQEAPVLTSA
jgi:transcriptional regulator with XRE-family HTH domain